MADSPDPTTTKPDPQHKVAAYQRVCESYHAVDDFRMKLLGLLPVATGTGVFLLLSGKSELVAGATSAEAVPETVRNALSAIGVFGFLFTLGLFAYELFGIKKCHYLIATGDRLERALRVEGQFTSRPRSVANFVNEPFASAVIYPACMAAWLYVAQAFVDEDRARVLALVVLGAGFAGTLLGTRRIAANERLEFRAVQAVTEAPVDRDRLVKDLTTSERGLPTRMPEAVRRLDARLAIRRLVKAGALHRDGDGALLVPEPAPPCA